MSKTRSIEEDDTKIIYEFLDEFGSKKHVYNNI